MSWAVGRGLVKVMNGKNKDKSVPMGWKVVNSGTGRIAYSGNMGNEFTANCRSVAVGDDDTIVGAFVMKDMTKTSWATNKEQATTHEAVLSELNQRRTYNKISCVYSV